MPLNILNEQQISANLDKKYSLSSHSKNLNFCQKTSYVICHVILNRKGKMSRNIEKFHITKMVLSQMIDCLNIIRLDSHVQAFEKILLDSDQLIAFKDLTLNLIRSRKDEINENFKQSIENLRIRKSEKDINLLNVLK